MDFIGISLWSALDRPTVVAGVDVRAEPAADRAEAGQDEDRDAYGLSDRTAYAVLGRTETVQAEKAEYRHDSEHESDLRPFTHGETSSRG